MVKSFKINLLDWLKTKIYVKDEIDTKLQNKSDSNHTHTTATVSVNGFLSKEDKSKLNGIATEANKTIVDSSLSSSSTNPVQNKVVKGALDSKAGTSIATTSANGLMSSSDKNKLDGIAIGATKVTVDTSLSSSSTNPVQNKVVNSALNGKANSSHNHSISNITNLQSALDNKSETGHTHEDATISKSGFMSKEDKVKLDGIAEGANKTIVDSSLSSTSVNPVQSKIINSALNEKANVSHTHNIGDISNLQSALDGKANTSHTHNDTYYTKDEINTRLGDIETILNEILGV